MKTRETANEELPRNDRDDKARVDRRPTRSEVDDFEEEGRREDDGGRGGFVSEHSDANPGGTTGEHSGQRPSRKN